MIFPTRWRCPEWLSSYILNPGTNTEDSRERAFVHIYILGMAGLLPGVSSSRFSAHERSITFTRRNDLMHPWSSWTSKSSPMHHSAGVIDDCKQQQMLKSANVDWWMGFLSKGAVTSPNQDVGGTTVAKRQGHALWNTDDSGWTMMRATLMIKIMEYCLARRGRRSD